MRKEKDEKRKEGERGEVATSLSADVTAEL